MQKLIEMTNAKKIGITSFLYCGLEVDHHYCSDYYCYYFYLIGIIIISVAVQSC